MTPTEVGNWVHTRAWAHTKQHGGDFHSAVRVVLAENVELAAAYELDRQRVVGQVVPQSKKTPDMFATSRERAPDAYHMESFQDWTVTRGDSRRLYDQLTPEQKAALKPAGKK